MFEANVEKLLAIAVLLQSYTAFGYTCVAKSSGAGHCREYYSGQHASSKGLAIQQALASCASSAPAGCICNFSSCSDNENELYIGREPLLQPDTQS